MNFPDWPRWFGWLWQTSWQAGVLAALVLLTLALCRHTLGPRWRLFLGLLVIIRLLAPALPESRFSIFRTGDLMRDHAADEPHDVALRQSRAGNPAAATSPAPVHAFPAPVSALSALEREPSISEPVFDEAPVSAPEAKPTSSDEPIWKKAAALAPRAIPWLWLGGCLAALSGVCGQHRLFQRWFRRQIPTEDPYWRELLQSCQALMGLKREVNLYLIPGDGSAAVAGLRRPGILLPQAVSQLLSEREIQYVLLHELAHIKRRDVLWNWALILLQALHWFNPLVRQALRRFRADRELVCDAIVMEHLDPAERRGYGNTLIKQLDLFSGSRPSPGLVSFVNNKTEIRRRITMISKTTTSTKPISTLLGLTATGILCCLAFTAAPTGAQDAALSDDPVEATETEKKKTKPIASEELGSPENVSRPDNATLDRLTTKSPEAASRPLKTSDDAAAAVSSVSSILSTIRSNGRTSSVTRVSPPGLSTGRTSSVQSSAGDYDIQITRSAPESDAARRVWHLRQAAVNLREAGMEKEAKRIEQEAERLSRKHESHPEEAHGSHENHDADRYSAGSEYRANHPHEEALESRVSELRKAVRQMQAQMRRIQEALANLEPGDQPRSNR